ncbi:tyrosine-type recombinase/integrase [Viridibacillus arvi]|uniref:tyrosine-type recombinase/integrase n=1 Tax=Viridibacillus arvi TaxID=263475 RepID=UPI003D2DBD77
MDLISPSNSLEIRENLTLAISNKQTVNELQNRLDTAERNREPLFNDFSDTDMIVWFLYENKHLNRSHDRTEKSTNEYRREIQQFVEALLVHSQEIGIDISEVVQSSLFRSLQSRHIRKYQEWLAASSPYVLKKGSYSPSTLDRKTTILRAFLRFLYKSAYVTEPLHEGLKSANIRNDERPNRDLGPSEVVMLLNKFRSIQHPVMFTIIHVLTTTGMRNEEFCRLKVKDLKRDTVNGGWYLRVLGKGNKMRDIPLKEKVYNSICMFRFARGLPAIDTADPESPLFTTNTGKAYTPSYLSQYVKSQIEAVTGDIIDLSGVTITPHVFRHAFAIISRVNGADVYDVMRSLGHEKIETTMIYLQKIFEKEQHSIHKWDPKLFGEFI